MNAWEQAHQILSELDTGIAQLHTGIEALAKVRDVYVPQCERVAADLRASRPHVQASRATLRRFSVAGEVG